MTSDFRAAGGNHICLIEINLEERGMVTLGEMSMRENMLMVWGRNLLMLCRCK
jgi:hypothetical protein